MAALQREWGTSVQPLKKLTVPTVLAYRQLAFTGRNVLMALKIQRDIKNIKPGATLTLA